MHGQETASATPEAHPSERMQQALDEMTKDIQGRITDINGTIDRLVGEREAYNNVLARIAPPQPIQLAGSRIPLGAGPVQPWTYQAKIGI